MKRIFFIESASGERRLEATDFPLSVGGPGADLCLQDISAGSVVAHIGLSDGHAFIQPTQQTLELFHNHQYISSSTWLKSGDQVQLGEQIIHWDIKGDQVFISIRLRTSETGLQPPSVPPPDAASEPISEVMPIATTAMSALKRRRLRNLVIGLFTLLSIIALFVLFATPVALNIKPEAESQSVSGFPPAVVFGGRMLVVPGSYTLNASRVGYVPLEQSFEVSSGGFQSFDFQLQELPGRLRITVDPEVPIKVSVGGIEALVSSGNIVSVERGLQQLSIQTDRYLPENPELNIAGYGELQDLDISLRPAWAEVQLDSQPSGAMVIVDGETVGTTPLTTEIIQGQHQIELALAGFKTSTMQSSLLAGTRVDVGIVELVPNDGRLVLESQPTGATVSVDGTFQGTTPLTMNLTSLSPHLLRLSKPGFTNSKKTLTLEPDEERRMRVDLQAEYGIVFVSSLPTDAGLTLDGKPAGTGTQRLRLTTRPHELTFSKPGYQAQTVNITPRIETSQSVDITLKTLAQVQKDARPEVLRKADGQELQLLEPHGSFKMGASRREAGRRANENQRLVELTKPFYLSSNEITNGAYRQFRKNHNSGSAEGVSLNGKTHPVVKVSWDDAARYCNWLSAQDNLPLAYIETNGKMMPVTPANTGYRLPTEAEWVYAARVAKRNEMVRYPWGNSYPPPGKVGNFADSQIADTLADVVNGYNDGFRGSAPVGSFVALPEGFHDFGGNVAEWTNDYYAVYPNQSERLVKDPTGPASGDHHVVRGSSWRDGSITQLRLSYRDYSRGPRDNLGFRIARYADE